MAEQCRATSKQSGERCRRLCASGKSVCYYHGGAAGSGGQPNNSNARRHGGYSWRLSPEELAQWESMSSDPALFLAAMMKMAALQINRILDKRRANGDELHIAEIIIGPDGDREVRKPPQYDDALIRTMRVGVRAAAALRLAGVPVDPTAIAGRINAALREMDNNSFEPPPDAAPSLPPNGHER